MLVDLPTISLLAFFKKHLKVAASVILMVTNNKTLLTKSSVVPTFKRSVSVSEVSFAKRKTSLLFGIRERTLTMYEGGPEGFTKFSKNIS